MKIIGYIEVYEGDCCVVNYCVKCKFIIKENIDNVEYDMRGD